MNLLEEKNYFSVYVRIFFKSIGNNLLWTAVTLRKRYCGRRQWINILFEWYIGTDKVLFSCGKEIDLWLIWKIAGYKKRGKRLNIEDWGNEFIEILAPNTGKFWLCLIYVRKTHFSLASLLLDIYPRSPHWDEMWHKFWFNVGTRARTLGPKTKIS